MAAANYDDVLEQLRGAGLLIDTLVVGRMTRCRIDGGDRERRGWYMLHEIQASGGDLLLVGSYGVWQGADNGVRRIELRKREISREQSESIRRRLADDRKRADQTRRRDQERAATEAAKAWKAYFPSGESEYLARKGVGAHGVRFTSHGAVVVPIADVSGKIHGLQFIRSGRSARESRRPAKEFWPAGLAKKGHFHLIGMPQLIVLVCEGYATGATLHEATQLPVAVAFDAGNLAPVCAALRKRYPGVRVLVCADDDIFATCPSCHGKLIIAIDVAPKLCPHCGLEHKRSNAGVSLASSAALEVGGAFLYPLFPDERERRDVYLGQGHKWTDFNDLHLAESLATVRDQVQSRIAELAWSLLPPRRNTDEGDGGLRPIDSVEELLEGFALVYGQNGQAFDHRNHRLVSLSDLRDACLRRELHRAWMEHPQRRIVSVAEVGFDPGGEDTQITCNLWAGWPTTPKPGCCDKLLELLRYMCSSDRNPDVLYRWVLRWIAYPLQHHGAKMKTTLVFHGPQGTGKNLMFEALMSIYGPYGRVIDQSAIEDRFNDWASRKLFLIADEVLARTELFHIKNKLKGFITGDWIRINPKNMAAYDERNHVNMVFLSNEVMPVVLEEDDRRHAVIWTPEKLPQPFYQSVLDEIVAGGVAALHHYLLQLDLEGFGPGTLPPVTDAKHELVQLGLDSPSRFYYALDANEIDGVQPRPCLSTDLYELYKLWCSRMGIRHAPHPKFTNALKRKHQVVTRKARFRAGSKVKALLAIAFLGEEQQPPDGVTQEDWLGEHVGAFRRAVDDYRGETK